MPALTSTLVLDRCPHCSVAHPNLMQVFNTETVDHTGQVKRTWAIYRCTRCGGVVTAHANGLNQSVGGYFPQAKAIKDDIPPKPRSFLQQASESLHAPAGAVMLAASAVDAMLRIKGYVEGSLYARIENAAANHLITAEMARWAHDVRLDANDQRHADESASLPTADDAIRAIDFATALAEFMFVLPNRVQRGIQQATG